jgi:hypothetical protein
VPYNAVHKARLFVTLHANQDHLVLNVNGRNSSLFPNDRPLKSNTVSGNNDCADIPTLRAYNLSIAKAGQDVTHILDPYLISFLLQKRFLLSKGPFGTPGSQMTTPTTPYDQFDATKGDSFWFCQSGCTVFFSVITYFLY